VGDQLSSFYSQDLSFRAVVAEATEAVRQMTVRQKTDPIASIILGRATVGAALLAGQSKEGQAIGIVMDGDGPLGRVFAEATFEGDVRGYCANANVHGATPRQLADIQNGRIGAAVGSGILRVVSSAQKNDGNVGAPEPQVGAVPIQTGEVGDDLAFYLQQSFQIQSVLNLGVLLDSDGAVVTAGGVLIELLPGASEFTIRMLERNVANAAPVSHMIRDGKAGRELLQQFTGEVTIMDGGDPRPLAFKCICSLGRVERSLMLLGRDALGEMIAEGKTVATRCEFCGTEYNIPLASLTRMRDAANKTK